MALLHSGCLPDPPPYDACTSGTSDYYYVAPKACSGHELVTLYEHVSQVEAQSTPVHQWLATVGSTLHAKMEQDADYVYWVDPTQWRIVRSPKHSNQGHQTLYWSQVSSSYGASPALAIVALHSNPKQLYVAEVSVDAAGRPTSRILGLDLEAISIAADSGAGAPPNGSLASTVHVLSNLADISLFKVAIRANRFYFTAAGTQGIGTGRFDWSTTTHTTDLSIAWPTAVHDFEFVDQNRLYTLSADDTSLQLIDIDTRTVEISLGLEKTVTSYVRLAPADAGVHLLHCAMTVPECSWSRVELDGTSRLVVSGLALQNASLSFVGDERGAYLLGMLITQQINHNRLLGFTESTTIPEVLAAPFQVDVPMALDDEFVYIADYAQDFVTEIGDSTTTIVSTDRLLRVRR